MTDDQIGEIYSLARDSFLGSQQSFQIQAYPFRMTPANLAHHRTNPHMAFWKMLKVGNDHFEATHLEPKVEVCNRRYVFDAQQPPKSSTPIVFDPTGTCPAFVVNPEIARPVRQKERVDEAQYEQLVKANVPVAPIHSGLDGGMNRVFLAQIGGSMPPADRSPQSRPSPTPTTMVRWRVNCSAPCSDRSRPHRRKSPRQRNEGTRGFGDEPDRARKANSRPRLRASPLRSRIPVSRLRTRRPRLRVNRNRRPRCSRSLRYSRKPTQPRRRVTISI